MDRPPTASSSRPKTSSGRAPSARVRPPSAQGPQPTPNMMNGGVQRPPSRMTMSRQGGRDSVVGAPIPIPPPSSMGRPPSQSQGRVPTSMGNRPTTGMARPPSSSVRPVTQQGLRAPPSRLGTGSSRQVFDKTYFVGILRSKINALNVEIARMKEKKQKAEEDRNELHAYETNATKNATELRDLQGKLIDLNVILDKVHMNGDMADIEMEAAREKDRANSLQGEVDDMFQARQLKEEEVAQLQMEVDEQKKLNEAVTSAMDPTMKDRFEDLRAESVILRDRVAEMEQHIEEMDENIAKYQMQLDNNPLKKKAVAIQETIDELKKKEEMLMKEKLSQETPEQKKDNMAILMRQLNNDIAVIEKQYNEVKDQANMTSEELHEYDSQGDGHHVKHHAQYLELLAKDHQIEDVLQTYPQQMPLLQQELEELSAAVVLNLRKISANVKKVNLDGQMTALDERGLNLNTGNVNELKELHIRLQDELITLEDMEMAINQEIDELGTQKIEIAQELEELESIMRKGSDGFKQELEEKQRRLEMEVPQMEDEFIQLQRNVENLRNDVSADPRYSKVKRINHQIAETERRNSAKSREMSTRQEEIDFVPIKEEALRLQQEYNKLLLENAGKRF